MTRTLTPRDLNRATLARQMLLARESVSVPQAVEQLAGLQSQVPNPPYIGLWTRLTHFQRDDLTREMEQYAIVRAALMRSTLHLVTAADHQRFRPTLQPALSKALRAFYGKRAQGLDIDKLVVAARPLLEAAPQKTGDIRTVLEALEPERDGDAMAYAVRNHLPQVQVPPSGTWGSGAPSYITAESVLGELPPPDLKALFFRYLAAFGPASIMDFQAWAGMTKLQQELEPFLDELVTYKSEGGRDLFDLPDAPLPTADTPALVRFLPEYDNVLVAYKDRARVYDEQHKKKIFLSAARVRATVLVDGFVQGVWKTERKKDTAILNIEPFTPLPDDVVAALTAEGERLTRFIEDGAAAVEVRFL